jgi:hypothetical protein
MMPGMSPTPATLHGMPVVVTYHMPTRVEQWRRPRSKAKRIRRKWEKNPRNWREVPVFPSGFFLNGSWVVSPEAYFRLMLNPGREVNRG